MRKETKIQVVEVVGNNTVDCKKPNSISRLIVGTQSSKKRNTEVKVVKQMISKGLTKSIDWIARC